MTQLAATLHRAADLWDAVVTHLDEEMTVAWEQQPGRTRADVAALLPAPTTPAPAAG